MLVPCSRARASPRAGTLFPPCLSLPAPMEMMPSLGTGCQGGIPVDPSPSQAGFGRKGWKTREEAAVSPGWKPFACRIAGCGREKPRESRTCSSQPKAKRRRVWGNAKKPAQLCRLQAQSPRQTGKTQPAFLIILLATPHEAAASRAAPGHQPPSHLPQPRQGGSKAGRAHGTL